MPLFYFLLFHFLATPPGPPPKIALIVTISHYAEGSGWANLHADKDAALMEHALLRQGFQKENIIRLQDAEATRDGILQAIKTHLVQKARKGGLAVFHFSGHGQQLRDDDGDEIDGFDEAIVPYDSPLHFREGIYEGENLIRDEELGQLLTQVRQKLGKRGHLLTILDSCHSGTGTRGMGTARGTDLIMADSAYIAGHLEEEPAPSSWENAPSISRLAPEVAFFGSSAHQLNYEMPSPEGGMVGSLTYSFCQSLEELASGSSYETLFDQVRLLMGKWVPRQQPQVEGDLELAVFGGRLTERTHHYRIAPGGVLSERAAILPAGKLNGLFPGTKVAFYPPHTYDWKQAKPWRTGRVSAADLLESEIGLDQPANPDSLLAAWIYISEYHYGELRIPVQLDIPDEQLRSAIQKESEAFSVLQFVDQEGELLIQQRAELLQVSARDGLVLLEKATDKQAGALSSHIVRYLLQYTQSQFLRTLEMEDPDRKVRAVLIPVKTKEDPERGVCRVGDTYQLEIRNEGQAGAYYSILDIQPDYRLNVLAPMPGSSRTAEEYFIRPGETQQYEIPFEVYPPTGLEVLKVIATDRPLDLRSIVANRGQSSANLHPFEQLLATTYWFDNRGGNTLSLLPELSIETLVFEIVE